MAAQTLFLWSLNLLTTSNPDTHEEVMLFKKLGDQISAQIVSIPMKPSSRFIR